MTTVIRQVKVGLVAPHLLKNLQHSIDIISMHVHQGISKRFAVREIRDIPHQGEVPPGPMEQPPNFRSPAMVGELQSPDSVVSQAPNEGADKQLAPGRGNML